MQNLSEYIKLLKIFVRVVEANKGIGAGDDDRILDAEGLAMKFFGHASAVFYLYQGTIIPNVVVNFFDTSSINILCRAALETFLVFHYVFVSPTSEDVKDFRYNSWVLAGLLERQTYPVQSKNGKEMLQEEAKLIAPLKERINNNRHFKVLKRGQQKDLLEKGKWRLQSWKEIALDAKLSPMHAQAFYSYLCEYAHAGNLSVLQLRTARTIQSKQLLCAATINFVIISIANMIKSYCKLFPRYESSMQEDKNAVALVGDWIYLGATPMDNINVE